MDNNKSDIKLPVLGWKTATCEVCGEPFDYLNRKRPHTCRNGECLYAFRYRIKEEEWASYQPTLFDSPGERG
ncbi:MAG: hypothetical protein V3T31_00985 [candidate division Zixibacteria bacterium]